MILDIYSKILNEAMKNMDDEGLLKVFSNKIFLTGLIIIAILSIGFYKKTEQEVKQNSGIVASYDTESISY